LENYVAARVRPLSFLFIFSCIVKASFGSAFVVFKGTRD